MASRSIFASRFWIGIGWAQQFGWDMDGRTAVLDLNWLSAAVWLGKNWTQQFWTEKSWTHCSVGGK
jgi:hypothetical protein